MKVKAQSQTPDVQDAKSKANAEEAKQLQNENNAKNLENEISRGSQDSGVINQDNSEGAGLIFSARSIAEFSPMNFQENYSQDDLLAYNGKGYKTKRGKRGNGVKNKNLSKGNGVRAALSKKTPKAQDVAVGEEYIIQRGDNLSTLAKKWGCTVQDILDANPQVGYNNIYAGQIINRPTKGMIVEKILDKSGKLISTKQTYYDNDGTITKTKEILKDGTTITLKNGMKTVKKKFKNGDYLEQRYDENGKLDEEEVVLNNNKKNGNLKSFFRSLFAEGCTRFEEKEYYEDKSLKRSYKDDYSKTEEIKVDKNGKTVETKFRNGDHLVQKYDKNGKLEREEGVLNGKKIEKYY